MKTNKNPKKCIKLKKKKHESVTIQKHESVTIQKHTALYEVRLPLIQSIRRFEFLRSLHLLRKLSKPFLDLIPTRTLRKNR